MVAPFMPDAEKLAAVREALPSVAAGIYLNTPVSGPLPAETARAMTDIETWELTTGRGHRDRSDDVLVRIEEARAGLAAIVGADVDRVLLTHGMADAFGRASRTIDWRPGDRFVVIGEPASDAIAGAMVGPAVDGVGSTSIGLPPAPGDDQDGSGVSAAAADDRLVAEVGEALRADVRLVAAPHVTASGRVLPVARLAAVVHEAGALLLVDGSQAVGAMPVSVDDLDVDLYAAPGWSWLLGPEGIGALVIGRRIEERRAPTAPSADLLGGDFHVPSVVGLARSCGWLSMYVGLEWIYRRAELLAGLVADRLAAIPNVLVVTPRDRMATTVAFRIGGWSAANALEELGARIFALASIVPGIDAIRIGVGFFNTVEELERFASGVELLATHTPETLPPRRQLTIIGGER